MFIDDTDSKIAAEIEQMIRESDKATIVKNNDVNSVENMEISVNRINDQIKLLELRKERIRFRLKWARHMKQKNMTQIVAFSGDLLNRQTTLNKRRHSLIASTTDEVKNSFKDVNSNDGLKFHSSACFETGNFQMSRYPTKRCNNYPRCHEFNVKLFLHSADPSSVKAGLNSILSEMDFKYADSLILAFEKNISSREINRIWKEAEQLKSSGKVQTIGVADMTIEQIRHLFDWCSISPDMLQICPSTYDEDFKEQNSTIKDIMTYGHEHHLRITTHNDPVLEFEELHLKAPALAEKYSTSYIGDVAAREFKERLIDNSFKNSKLIDLYGILPRLRPKRLHKLSLENKPVKTTAKNQVANTRNPFSRVHSAWHDKMRINAEHNQTFREYIQAIEPLEIDHQYIPADYYTSFEAYVEYIASNPGDSKMNGHWRTAFNLCSACALDYSIITHLDNSEEEIPFVLEKINLAGKIEIAGKYSWDGTKRIKDQQKLEEARKKEKPSAELEWKNVPRKTAELIYKHYFLDFVVFGYSPEDVLKFIEAADSGKKRPTEERIQLSRNQLHEKEESYLEKFTNFICNKGYS
ncbi:Oidioi.mRNA.OKI2018_I69.chr1.g1354.t1.cds [Oikopleura dioica]|uniref:Carbohydrate sulfotransferase n=1 Tax=Oikopleura dioica TaxID=34765 RepID=A0ABN7SWV4_OIKDI|nr:Oidioi.mRNA.OKI2018_I69.chr1.g1354.t1.cds [Oikopleura dioica]